MRCRAARGSAGRDADAQETEPARRRHRLLAYPAFAELCAEHGVHGPETFAEVLHHAGMVFYRRGLFDDRMLLDQSWALNAVYALFTRDGGVHQTLRRLGGRFDRPLLDLLLWGRRGLSADDQHSLIGLMLGSGVCFVHRRADDPDATEYVAPDLLPEGRDGPALAEALAPRWAPLPGPALEASLRLAFLSPSMGRAVLSDLGALAGDTALYWRYGLCLYDADSGASAMVEALADTPDDAQPGDGADAGYGGRLRIQVKGGDAERLLATLVERIGKLNKRGDWGGTLTRGTPAATKGGASPEPPAAAPADPPPTPPTRPEVFISYAGRQEQAEPLVDDLIDGLAKHDIRVLRDRTDIQPGDLISAFMRRISSGRCVLLVISQAYLRSPYCMTELHGIWTQARRSDADFLRRIVPLVQPGADIGTIEGRIAHAVHWKQRYESLDALIRAHGPAVVGERDFAQFKLMDDYWRQVGDLLAYANDVLLPRERPALERDNFAVVRALIEQALR